MCVPGNACHAWMPVSIPTTHHNVCKQTRRIMTNIIILLHFASRTTHQTFSNLIRLIFDSFSSKFAGENNMPFRRCARHVSSHYHHLLIIARKMIVKHERKLGSRHCSLLARSTVRVTLYLFAFPSSM